jgi:hypothetical protein
MQLIEQVYINYDFLKFRNVIIKKVITIKETTCSNSHVFFIPMKILDHIIWHVMDKHEKK